MQDIKDREFRDSGSIANTKICFEVPATALRPRLHTAGFSLYVHTEPLTQGISTEDLANTIRSTQLLSPTNNLYTRGKAQQLSPLYLEGWALSQTTITSTLRGIGTKLKLQPHSPLHLEG